MKIADKIEIDRSVRTGATSLWIANRPIRACCQEEGKTFRMRRETSGIR